MRAAVLRDQEIVVDDIPMPEPKKGEVLVKTLTCGICGSDLGYWKHGKEMADIQTACGHPHPIDLQHGLVLGHEFCAEIVDFGPDTSRQHAMGTRICAVPSVLRPDRIDYIGFSSFLPGGFGEYMVLSEDKLFPVDNGLPAQTAALTEPLAVVYHAVNKARIQVCDAPLVVGCGPIGLATIQLLKTQGVDAITAVDPMPQRRSMAKQMGASYVLESIEQDLIENWMMPNMDKRQAYSDLINPLHSSPWVVFNCVGARGVLNQISLAVPRCTRIIQIGLCIQDDLLQQAMASPKELTIQFVNGYSEQEFGRSLQMLSEGEIDLSPLLGESIGLDSLNSAMSDLAKATIHGKIMVEPWR